MTQRVLITQPVFESSVSTLRARGLDVEPRDGDPMSAEQLAAAVADADPHALITLLTDRVGPAVFDAGRRLTVVANVAAGVDNIDVDAAAAAGVVVTNTPGVLTDATADLTMALLLAAARRLVEGDRMVRDGRFHGWTLRQELMGLDVAGATLGIVGMGQIGRAVARRAHLGFGMPIRYLDRGRPPDPDLAALDAEPVAWEELLATSDVLSLHAPLTPETHHLVDAGALAAMKPTALLVNTARGPLVDERALADALADGQIAGAALDVFEREPEVEARLLAQHERVVLAPHIGSATETTRRRMSDMAAENVVAVLAGQPAPNPVTERAQPG